MKFSKFLVILSVFSIAVACNDSSIGKNSNSGGNYTMSLDAYKKNYKSVLAYKNTADALGFYDWTHEHEERAVRNDLNGSLSGMVQFAQSHTIDPKDNAAKYMPLLVQKRAALLLFTPSNDIADSISSLKAEVYLNGMLQGTVEMNDPSMIPVSDTTAPAKKQVVYSKKAWTGELPWNWVQKGMELKFIDGSSREGILAANDIEFGAPAEGIFAFLRIGFLTNAPTNGSGYMMNANTAAIATTDYFQTVPLSRLINVRYEDRVLNRVIVANGTVYDKNSSDPAKRFSHSNSGVYSGDMRENVGKSQVSVGINMANFGITSWNMSQSHPYLFFHTTVHLSQGRYIKKGVTLPEGTGWDDLEYSQDVRHGLSGGNNIASLLDTQGNEFSHEIGHVYGQGHYEQPKGYPSYWQRHHADSGWGYNPYYKKMRGNLNWGSNGSEADNNFQGIYNYQHNTQSDGYPDSSMSKFTYMTGFSTLKAQNFVSARPVVSEQSSTGYYKWNKDTQEMEEYSFEPGKNELKNHAARLLETPKKPYKIGVPVITILGGYDPVNISPERAVMYPYFRGNYGNVFNHIEPDMSAKACWIEVDFQNGGTDKIAVLAKRVGTNANQFHVNIEEARKPNAARLYCQEAGADKILLDNITIPTELEPMQPPVIVGQERGYQDVIDLELKTLNANLPKYAGQTFPNLSANDAGMLLRVYDNISSLNEDAKAVALRYTDAIHKKNIVAIFMDKNADALASGDQNVVEEFRKLLSENGIMESQEDLQIKQSAQIRIYGNRCVRVVKNEDGTYSESTPNNCSADDSTQQWVMDANGKMHNKAYPDQCLVGNGNNKLTSVKACEDTAAQKWSFEASGNKYRIRWQQNTNICMDHFRYTPNVGTYSCGNGDNQKVANILPSTESPLLTLMSGDKLKVIYDIFGN